MDVLLDQALFLKLQLLMVTLLSMEHRTEREREIMAYISPLWLVRWNLQEQEVLL